MRALWSWNMHGMAHYDCWNTEKKLLNVNTSAFCVTQSSAGRVRIFWKSAVELPRLIETAICENISKHRNSGSELFICNAKCYKRLQRLKKAKKNLESKEEICGIYQSINRREKRQRADQVVEIETKTSHIWQQQSEHQRQNHSSLLTHWQVQPLPNTLLPLVLLIVVQLYFSEILWHGHRHSTRVLNS